MKPKSKHSEIILAGSGGQGLILAGILLAEAAVLEGKNVVQTQSYGVASRGGLSLAELIVDENEIIFQQVRRPDCVLALSEDAAIKYESWTTKGVPMLYDRTLVTARDAKNFAGYDFTRKAGELGSVASVNMIALAAVVAFTGVVRLASLDILIRKRFQGPALEMNLKLVTMGAELVTL